MNLFNKFPVFSILVDFAFWSVDNFIIPKIVLQVLIVGPNGPKPHIWTS